MAELIGKNKKLKIKDGKSIVEACKEIGVPFSCEQGHCGICAIDILEGKENLSEMSKEEENNGFSQEKRLACCCKIKSGKVKIDF